MTNTLNETWFSEEVKNPTWNQIRSYVALLEGITEEERATYFIQLRALEDLHTQYKIEAPTRVVGSNGRVLIFYGPSVYIAIRRSRYYVGELWTHVQTLNLRITEVGNWHDVALELVRLALPPDHLAWTLLYRGVPPSQL